MEDKEAWEFVKEKIESLTLEQLVVALVLLWERARYMMDLRRRALLDRLAPGDRIVFERGFEEVEAVVEAVTRRRLRVRAYDGSSLVDPLQVLSVESRGPMPGPR